MSKRFNLLIDQLPTYFKSENIKSRPKNIFDCFIQAAAYSNMGVVRKPHTFFKNGFEIYATCAPTWRIILFRILGKKIIFLNWQRPRLDRSLTSFFKNAKLFLAINYSSTVLTNNPNQRVIFGKKLTYFPYPVDRQFFFTQLDKHQNYDFVLPGDNSRDYDLLADIALKNPSLTFSVITRNAVHGLLTKLSNVFIFSNLSFSEYRNVLSESSCGLILTRDNNHLAGQTVVLELLSMGKAVCINNPNLFMIFKGYQRVYFINSDLGENLAEYLSKNDPLGTCLEKHDFYNASSFLAKIFDGGDL